MEGPRASLRLANWLYKRRAEGRHRLRPSFGRGPPASIRLLGNKAAQFDATKFKLDRQRQQRGQPFCVAWSTSGVTKFRGNLLTARS